MPYVLAAPIEIDSEGQWREGTTYRRETIYDIHSQDPKAPPVQYDAHILKPHSFCHVDAPAHILPGGETVDKFFTSGQAESFFGLTAVIKIRDPQWQEVPQAKGQLVYRIPEQELRASVQSVTGSADLPERILISADPLPVIKNGTHDPSYAFVLSHEAARWLVSASGFRLYGTSWKSTDFEPGSRERPIHKIIFQKQALICECLDLGSVPEGVYFLSAFPIPLVGAAESPVTPVLFTREELLKGWR